MKVEQVESAGRLLLWLVLSGCLVVSFVVVPLQWAKNNTELAVTKEELRETLKKLAASERAPELMPLKSFGELLQAVDYSASQGLFWFTNVSPRSGVVCMEATLVNESTGEKSTSLASCSKVEAYATVEIKTQFAGLGALCPEGGRSCKLTDVIDAPAAGAVPGTKTPAAPSP